MKTGFIRAYGSSKYGMGHLFRSLAVANFLKKKGIVVKFLLMTAENAELKDFFKDKPFEIAQTDGEIFPVADFLLYDMPFPDPGFIANFRNSNPIAQITALDYSDSADENITTIINLFDHQRMLAKREKNNKTRFLSGPEFAIIREQFFPLRNLQKNISETIENVLITFGGADPAGNTLKLLENPKWFQNMRVTAIIGVNFTSKKQILEKSRTLPHNFKVIEAVGNIETYMSNADLVICGAGTTLIESMFLGIPTIVIPQTGDEAIFGKFIETQDGCIFANFVENGVKKALNMMKDCEFRKKMSENAMLLVDGKGVGRIIETLKSLERQVLEYEFPVEPVGIDDWNALKR